jgi:hypothetical protein
LLATGFALEEVNLIQRTEKRLLVAASDLIDAHLWMCTELGIPGTAGTLHKPGWLFLGNDVFWPNLRVRPRATVGDRPGDERRVTTQTQNFSQALYSSSLTGASRPKAAV